MKTFMSCPIIFQSNEQKKLFTFKGTLELKRNGFWQQKLLMLFPYVHFLNATNPINFCIGFFGGWFFFFWERNYQNIFDQILRKLWNLPFNKARFSEKDRNKVFHSGLKVGKLIAMLCRNKRLHKTFLCVLLGDTSKDKWENSHGESQNEMRTGMWLPSSHLHQFCWPKQAGKFLLTWISSKWLSQLEERGAREARDHSLTGFVTFLSRIYYEQNFEECLFPTKSHPRYSEITSV